MELYFTKTEKIVFHFAVRGKSAAFTAEKLFVTKGAIRYHLTNIYKKCRVRNQRELIILNARGDLNV